MKEDELRRHTTCSVCGRKLGQTGIPIFWVVKARRFGLNFPALQRQQGLAMLLGGNGYLARVMGPDEEMANPLGDEVELTFCEECALKRGSVGELALIEMEGRGT